MDVKNNGNISVPTVQLSTVRYNLSVTFDSWTDVRKLRALFHSQSNDTKLYNGVSFGITNFQNTKKSVVCWCLTQTRLITLLIVSGAGWLTNVTNTSDVKRLHNLHSRLLRFNEFSMLLYAWLSARVRECMCNRIFFITFQSLRTTIFKPLGINERLLYAERLSISTTQTIKVNGFFNFSIIQSLTKVVLHMESILLLWFVQNQDEPAATDTLVEKMTKWECWRDIETDWKKMYYREKREKETFILFICYCLSIVKKFRYAIIQWYAYTPYINSQK